MSPELWRVFPDDRSKEWPCSGDRADMATSSHAASVSDGGRVNHNPRLKK